MNTLPPLRTVASGKITDTPAPVGRAFDPVLRHPKLSAAARDLLQDLFDLRLTDPQPVRQFLLDAAATLPGLTTRELVGQALTHAKILTPYQRDRVVAGSTFGLALGAYRVLDRLGGGSVGVVFLGEHVLLRRRVALKVVPVDDTVSPNLVDRFHAEMRLLAGIDHPNVVTAHDAGVVPSPGGGQQALHYLVLELVAGGDLEQYVYDHGAQPVPRACEWARQTAAGLQAAHDRHLVHRDLKPSNLLLTPDRRVKVVDFGLARELASTKTAWDTLLGSVEFMAPEQSTHPTAVGPPADVYGLGATLFWVLTGQLPFPRVRPLAEMVKALQTGTARRVRQFRPDVPAELDRFLARMLARNPADRPTAVEVMGELARYAGPAAEGAPEKYEVTPGDEAERLREVVRLVDSSLRARSADVRAAQDAVVGALTRMAEAHDGGSPAHPRRVREYVRVLVEHLAAHPDWTVLQDGDYAADLVRCAPLHDVGMIGLADAVIGKAGPLTADERAAVETHPQVGCDILDRLVREHGDTLAFLGMARAVVRSHHERWDGTGYPDRLDGPRIPPPARVVALADVYDALRRDRADRPGLGHAAAVTALAYGSDGQFDPAVRAAFQKCEKAFETIYLTVPDDGQGPLVVDGPAAAGD